MKIAQFIGHIERVTGIIPGNHTISITKIPKVFVKTKPRRYFAGVRFFGFIMLMLHKIIEPLNV